MEFLAIILAAGKGSRLKSNLSKPLHEVAGYPLITWVSKAAHAAGASTQICVISPDEQQLYRELSRTVKTVTQDAPKGTGDAVRCCLPHIAKLPKDLPTNAANGSEILIINKDASAVSLLKKILINKIEIKTYVAPVNLLSSDGRVT